MHVAHRLRAEFPDGQGFVDLHGHTAGRSPAEPGDVLATLLAADGVDPRRLPDCVEARPALWRARLAGRPASAISDEGGGLAEQFAAGAVPAQVAATVMPKLAQTLPRVQNTTHPDKCRRNSLWPAGTSGRFILTRVG